METNDTLKSPKDLSSIRTFCQVTGAFNIFLECSSFNYSIWVSTLVLRKVLNPTNNLKIIHFMSHFMTVLIAGGIVIAIGFTFGFGISVRYKTKFINKNSVLVYPMLWDQTAVREDLRRFYKIMAYSIYAFKHISIHLLAIQSTQTYQIECN